MRQSTKGCAQCSPTSLCTRADATGRVRRGPKVGLVVAKKVGNRCNDTGWPDGCGTLRGRSSTDLNPADRVVIRALPSSRYAISARLEQQLRVALKRAQLLDGTRR